MVTVLLRRGPNGEFPPVKLPTGEHHRIVLVLGRPAPTVTVPGQRFAYDLAFPAPGIAGMVRFAVEAMDESPSSVATVFGHADKTGSDAYNKDLSDRRAAAFLAMMTGNGALLDQVAHQEDWGSDIYQAILRALGPNPGPIDGKPGELTEKAVTGFQQEYSEGVYHRDSGRSPRETLAVTGKLDDATKGALRDAYLAVFSARIPIGRFHGPKRAGCSEFVPHRDQAGDNRRVTLAVFRKEIAPSAKSFPCVEGKASACPLDSISGRRCPFYREFVNEPQDGEFASDTIPFFDFQWLRQSNTVTHLSAITSVADDAAVTFRVLRVTKRLDDVPIPNSNTEGAPPEVGEQLVTLTGTVKNGIAFATWEHEASETPFDRSKWDIDLGLDLIGETNEDDVTPDELFNAVTTQPPIFEITCANAWGVSAPPGVPLNRINLDRSAGHGLALTSSGFLVAFDARGGRLEADERSVIVEIATSQASLSDLDALPGDSA